MWPTGEYRLSSKGIQEHDVIYGSECWSSQLRHKKDVKEMKMLSSIYGVMKSDHICNIFRQVSKG